MMPVKHTHTQRNEKMGAVKRQTRAFPEESERGEGQNGKMSLLSGIERERGERREKNSDN
mgnify:CR=1 FL=1